MRTVASHAVAAMLAAAEVDCFRFVGLVFLGREFAALVAAVAKRLARTLAAGAVPIAFSGFNFNGKGRLLGDMGFLFGHVFSSDYSGCAAKVHRYLIWSRA